MKRYPAFVAALLLTLSLSAQTTSEEFAARYDRLVARVGIAGAGVETLLERWEEAFPDDLKMLEGKFACYLEKSGTPKVIRLPRDRYLGREPLLAGKDSTGAALNFFEDMEYDDELFGLSQSALDRAIALASSTITMPRIRNGSIPCWTRWMTRPSIPSSRSRRTISSGSPVRRAGRPSGRCPS